MREQRAAAAAASVGVAHPTYVDVNVRVRSFEGDGRYLAVMSRLPAAALADAGLFLPPLGHDLHPRCFRCGVMVDFQGLVVGQVAENAHRVAVAARPGLACAATRARQPPVYPRNYEHAATPSAKRKQQQLPAGPASSV